MTNKRSGVRTRKVPADGAKTLESATFSTPFGDVLVELDPTMPRDEVALRNEATGEEVRAKVGEARSVGSEYTPEQRERFGNLMADMRAEKRGPAPPGVGAWSDASMGDSVAGPYFSTDRTRAPRPEVPPSTLRSRLRDAWWWLVNGWRGGQ